MQEPLSRMRGFWVTDMWGEQAGDCVRLTRGFRAGSIPRPHTTRGRPTGEASVLQTEVGGFDSRPLHRGACPRHSTRP